MIKIKDIKVGTEEILSYLSSLKDKQKKVIDKDNIFYPKISLYIALKHKILFKNLLLHPKVLREKKFYQDKNQIITSNSLRGILSEVLEFELTSNDETLSTEERNEIIKVFKKIAINSETEK